jgi:hypothetical protein
MIVNPQTLDNYYFGGDQFAGGFTRYLAKLELVMLSKGHAPYVPGDIISNTVTKPPKLYIYDRDNSGRSGTPTGTGYRWREITAPVKPGIKPFIKFNAAWC